VLSAEGEGDRRQPAIAHLAGHDLLAVWSDDTRTGADSSGSAVTGRLIEAARLFPGSLRPGGSPPPALGLAPATGAEGPPPSRPVCGEVPGSAGLDGPCVCDADCAPGSECLVEAATGFPGGNCVKNCDTSKPQECGPEALCIPNGPVETHSGLCFAGCATSGDCVPGRVCSSGACFPRCTSDAECRSRHCDPYRQLCSDGTPSKGGGIYDRCLRNEDCRSGLCTHRRCQTPCLVGRAPCPEGGVCVSLGAEDAAACHPPCPDGTCTDAALTCVKDGSGRYCR
jgi:hypothetical protein